MNDATVSVKRKTGRPRIDATLVGVTIPPPLLSVLDRWIAEQPDKPGRPEAIRRLVRLALETQLRP
jgi:metal-responsive CopG/Arc/MetJ family transcriptional regulator